MYPNLVKQIKELLRSQPVVVVAISGHGGSGKSTLADRLAKEFAVADNQLVRIDSLHAQDYMQANSIYKQHDWATLTNLLDKVRGSDRMNYLSRDWKGNEKWIDVPRPNVVIVEGVRLIRPSLLPYFDLNVWIDCPLEFATERALERNRQQGDSEEAIDLWRTKWVPEAKEYVADAEPQKIADFVYTEYESKP